MSVLIRGMENVLVKNFMVKYRGANRASFVEGKSVHNYRIERLWRFVFQGVQVPFTPNFSNSKIFLYLKLSIFSLAKWEKKEFSIQVVL